MLKIPKVSLFTLFGTMILFKILIFCITLFLNINPAIIFFITVRILEVEVQRYCAIFEFLKFYPNYIAFYQGGGGGSKTSAPICPSTLYPNFRRYMRSNLRSTKDEAYDRKKRSHLSKHATSELLKRFPSTKGNLWVFRNSFLSFS